MQGSDRLNYKMLLAPLFGVVLALLIAMAVITYWPQDQPHVAQSSTPLPSTGGTPAPIAAPSAANLYYFPPMMLLLLAVVAVAAIILLYFRKEPM